MPDETTYLPAYVSPGKLPRLYHWLAPVYDLAGVLIGSQARILALERARIQNGEHVLELGVGTGLTFAQIVRRNPAGRNEGLDITEAMVARARQRLARMEHTNYHLSIGDARQPPYAEESFDCIVSTFMLDLFSREEMEAMLKRWTSLLRSDGRLVLVYQAVTDCWHEQLWDTVYRLVPYILGGCRGIAPIPLIEDAGLEIASRDLVTRLGVPQEIVVARPAAEPAPTKK